MTKYDIIKDIIKTQIVLLLQIGIGAMVICALPWGSYGWMGSLDFRKLTPTEAQKYAVTHRLERDILMEVLEHTVKVEAGTNISILGWYVRVPEMDGKKKAWFVETEDGRRGLCDADQLRDVITLHTLAIYDHARQDDDWLYFHNEITAEELQQMKDRGITFEEFDSLYGPAVNAAKDLKTGIYYASYRGLDYHFGDKLKEGQLVGFRENRLDTFRCYTQHDVWCPKWIAPYATKWMKKSVAFVQPGYYILREGYGPLQASFYPYKWMARSIMGFLDVLFVFIVSVVAGCFLGYFLDNKSLSNAFFEVSFLLLCAIPCTLYFYYTMELSANIYGYLAATFFMTVTGLMALTDHRCPKCRSLIHWEFIDQEFGEVKVKHYDVDDYDDDIVDRQKNSDWSMTQYKRTHYTQRMTERTQDVKTTVRCPECGHTETWTSQNKGVSWARRINKRELITETITRRD